MAHCPNLEALWEQRQQAYVSIPDRAALKYLCAFCERDIPEDCPELCVMCRNQPGTIDGGCELECGCKQPADEELLDGHRKRTAELSRQGRVSATRRRRKLYETTSLDPDHPNIIA